eukprot:1161868-Pelagomonas_calceolata.AAC.1
MSVLVPKSTITSTITRKEHCLPTAGLQHWTSVFQFKECMVQSFVVLCAIDRHCQQEQRVM